MLWMRKWRKILIFASVFELHMMKNKKFKGYRRYALVTGAASGMGRIYCKELALRGYNVVLVDINAAGLDETATIVREAVESSDQVPADSKEAFKLLKVVQDLSTMDAADKVYEATEAAGCEVEVLVNNITGDLT